MSKVPAIHFVEQIRVNVENEKLSDKEFRQFINNSLSVVETKEEYDKERNELTTIKDAYFELKTSVSRLLDKIKI